MKIWLDIHLPPAIAPWIKSRFDVDCEALRDTGMSRASDTQIFSALRTEGQVVITKDADFVALVESKGPPPQVIWVTCGNTSHTNLRRILERTLGDAIELLARGEPLVELRDQ